ncbi:hypothetical protein DPEC_G00305090 [Dallia pectoralis]|uniref:Uncharacterized protein n=1 Tax=Dallia pectoralis TaxID=75939 RepID=A0ACC2FDZ1_DALPE|nr:hypothetical protein DPEC_G00305090 [Dallia pectoralis]
MSTYFLAGSTGEQYRAYEDSCPFETIFLKMQRCLVLCMVMLALVSADECPDGGVCEKDNTCCKAPSNGFECCPLHQAECCRDHMHCCPVGTLCLVNESLCVNATVSLPWVERVSAKHSRNLKSFRMISTFAVDEDDKVCSDNSHCPSEFSCLQTSKGYGCCPVAQAVSCSDGKHCCPQGYQCSIDGSSCIKLTVPDIPVMCNDGKSECPEETTCCETPEGSWGCCPMLKAVCCEDKIHCCPDGSTCDIKQSKCISAREKEMPMWAKFPARARAEWENPKKVTTHIPDTTVTTSPVSLWKGAISSPPLTKANGVLCNETMSCEDRSTCCKTEQGDWACCPLPEATCCSDFIHCCAHGKKCNVPAQTCDDPSGMSSEPWLEKIPAVLQKGNRLTNVPCDSTHACPDNTTCCKTDTGDWACCPIPEAVCCEDHVHCCPHGKKCNLPAQTCDDPSGRSSEPWLEKIPAVLQKGNRLTNVPCDSTHACPDNTTCCKTDTGDWACCPIPEAVCCEDHVHCCPHGKKCNLPAQTCDDPSGRSSEPWLEKIPAVLQKGNRLTNVPCDSTHACPDNTTCCKTDTGDWACCPIPEAVCCEDHVHCCPHGKKCNLPAQTCDDPSGRSSEPWLEKIPAVLQKGNRLTNVPCDSIHSCPDSTTCCKTDTGDWACCLYPKAVCCADHVHCCPKGSTCDLVGLTCNSPSGPMPMLGKVPAFTTKDQGDLSKDIEVPEEDEDDDEVPKIQCDSHSTCPKGTTCCFMKTQKWGCCPLPQAVCCADGEHCCPKDYKCDVSMTSCTKGEVVIPWYNKLPAKSEDASLAFPTVMCDAQNRCPKDSSCCMLSTGLWGCCPLQQAVCCGDEEHCCPHGYSCNLGTGSCQKRMLFHFPTVPLTRVSASEPLTPQVKDIHCGGTFSCPDQETCCKDSATTWACCPAPNAVCCDDMKHCCPTGYTCAEGGTCDQSTGFNWAHWQVFFTNKKSALRV